jgi:hypothetical protein
LVHGKGRDASVLRSFAAAPHEPRTIARREMFELDELLIFPSDGNFLAD